MCEAHLDSLSSSGAAWDWKRAKAWHISPVARCLYAPTSSELSRMCPDSTKGQPTGRQAHGSGNAYQTQRGDRPKKPVCLTLQLVGWSETFS